MPKEPHQQKPKEPPPQKLPEPEVAADLMVFYSNYAAVTITAEECVFRWCERSPDQPEKPIEHFRVYITISHAKRLLAALARSIQSHEQMFGPTPLERTFTEEGKKMIEAEAKRLAEIHKENHGSN